MVKKILFPIISIFLAYRSYEIINTLWIVEASELNLPIKIILSFLVNLFLTGVFAFMGFAYPTNKLLPEGYYQIKNPNSLANLSKVLKVAYFKRFLLFTFWGKEKNRKKYFDGTKEGLSNFDFQTRQSEFGHLGALLVIQIAVVIMLMKGHYQIAILTTTFNLIVNFYPVILQRSHRVQIERIKKILNRKLAS